MTVEVVPLTEADIPDAIEVIQQAFAEDPYFQWVFDPSNVSSDRQTKHSFQGPRTYTPLSPHQARNPTTEKKEANEQRLINAVEVKHRPT